MLQTTKAIVLNAFAYNETSLITKLYTKEFGLKGYIIKGVRKSKTSLSASLFQPLQLIEAEVYSNQRQSLQVLKTATIIEDLSFLRLNIVKSTLTMFLTEVISHSISGETSDQTMFDFLSDTIKSLNAADNSLLAEFHLHFMIDFADILGFNLINYDWEKDNEIAAFLNSTTPTPTKIERNAILSTLISFYELHITAGRKILSHNVLHEILN
ncbi:MAG: DNA repair protein RecO [Bacteroidales bacterium]|jgi:DNA repair protein RecO (recombination protein O)|nr:DNA repair protein RecO [Bacteroidales bacterium]